MYTKEDKTCLNVFNFDSCGFYVPTKVTASILCGFPKHVQPFWFGRLILSFLPLSILLKLTIRIKLIIMILTYLGSLRNWKGP